MARVFEDLSGKKFGKLTVLSFAGKASKGEKLWSCQCECGKVTVVRQGHLKSGHTTTCGCGKFQLNDFTGKTFGFLTVLRRTDDYVCPGNHKHYVKYTCRCECGNIVDVLALNLKSGNIKSCGCQNPHRLHDLSGQRFGKLVVQHQVEDYVNPSGRHLIRYLCECDCGNEIYALANTLRVGDVSSCGCMGRSRGENIVRSWLDNHAIDYDRPKKFDDCISDKGFKLSYDFYLPDYNCLIECHGIQHYESIEFFGGEDQLKSQQRHDFLKQVYADEHGMPLLVIDCRVIIESEICQLVSKFIDDLC